MFRDLRLTLWIVPLLGLTACSRTTDEEAERLVRTYNERLIEAYRAADAELMEGLVGDEEASKLLGLIGVKLDMGITLDAELVSLDVLRIEPGSRAIKVFTDERWRYRDRRIGGGEIVGQESSDHYRLCYVLERSVGGLVVDSVSFTEPPEVGRSTVLNQAPALTFHGIEPAPEDRGAEVRESARQDS